MCDQARSGETYSNTGNPTYEQRVLAQTGLTYRAPFLLAHLHPGQRLLDVGCGPGSITCDLAALVAPGEVIGMDLQPSQVAAAQELATQRGITTIRFEVGTIYALPFPAASFDVVTALAVLFHLRDPLAALRELRRVLRPGGIVALVDIDAEATFASPASPAVRRLLELTFRVIEHAGGNANLGREHRRLLAEAGFAYSEAYPVMESAGSLAATREAAETWIMRLQGPVQEGIILDEGWATREELNEIYTAMRAWGARPDALLCHLRLGALGWAQE